MTRRLCILAAVLISAASPSAAHAASAHFFWAGFDVQPSVIEEGDLERTDLEAALGRRFGAPESGALHRFLRSIALDRLDYWGAGQEALGAIERRTSFDNVYGVFLSIDRLLRFEPSELETVVPGMDPLVERQYFWFALAGLNVFSVQTRNIVYSRPVLLAPTNDEGFALAPPETRRFVLGALEVFAEELEDPDNPFTRAMRDSLQVHFGERGEDSAATRSRQGLLQETYGVVGVAPIVVTPPGIGEEGLTASMRERLHDLTRFYFSMQLSRFEPVTPVFEQQPKLASAARGVVVEGRRGHVDFDYDESCRPGFRRSGEYVFCVSIPPPRHAIRLAPSLRMSEDDGTRRYRALVEYEIADSDEPIRRRLEGAVSYRVPRPPLQQRLYDRPYGFAIANAISSLDAEGFAGRKRH